MKHKFVTHEDVQAEIYAKYPGLKKEVQLELHKIKIAEKIVKLRKKARLSQKNLADKIGTTQSVIARLENSNYKDYRVSTLQRIAAVTGGTFQISSK